MNGHARTKERVLKVTIYKQGNNSIIHLDDVSDLQNGSKYAVNSVYYLDEASIKEIYSKIKNLKSEIELARQKRRQEYEQKRKDELKDQI